MSPLESAEYTKERFQAFYMETFEAKEIRKFKNQSSDKAN